MRVTQVLVLFVTTIISQMVSANLGRPSGDVSCQPSFPELENRSNTRPLNFELSQGGFLDWESQVVQANVVPSVAFSYNLTMRDIGNICQGLENATAGSWCESTLQQLTSFPRSVGFGASNQSVVCGGLRQLIIKVEFIDWLQV